MREELRDFISIPFISIVLDQWSCGCLKTPLGSPWKVAEKSKPRRLRFNLHRLSLEDFEESLRSIVAAALCHY